MPMASKAKPKDVPSAAGFVKQGFEHVQDVFRKSIESGIERGGSFAAYYKGELVVNLWGGFADEESRRPWKHNSASHFYSTTKAASALVIAHLVDRGLVKYDQLVSSFWQQFAQNGKEKITLKQIVSLKAGLPVLSEPFMLASLRDDPEGLELLLAKQPPWDTGDAAAYSPIVIGLYLDQIVRKLDPRHRSLAEYFRDEIAQPFGIDFYIGMPKCEFWRTTRQCVTVRGEEYKKYQQQLASNSAIDPQLLITSATQPTDFLRNSYINDPEFVELPCGASHGVGSAAGMAKLQGILANGGCTTDGRRLLSQEVLHLLQTPLSIGTEKTFGIDLFYSYGMELLPILEGKKVHYNVGHGGFGGQFAAADLQHKTGWAYCTNFLDPTIMLTGSTKWKPLEKALFQCVHALEGLKCGRTHLHTADQLREALRTNTSKL